MVAQRSRFIKPTKRSGTKKAVVFTVLGLVSFFALVLLFSNAKLYQRRASLGEQSQRLQEEIEELSRQSQELKEDAAAKETEAYQERVLREQGLYQKPGEQVITILPAEERQNNEGEGGRIWWNPFTWFQ